MMTKISEIGKSIQKVRQERKLTQEQLAIKAGIPYTTLAKIESGMVNNPRMKTLQKIALALKISIDELVKNVKSWS
ncbi:MAG: helix-turn-helix transcriptional regulator [Candidatus Delongbacteria bacterium]|nr:helix-turn-helix transcriptional regulator [Candidatus Delongbacteria bacterium]